jgi:hypothetical protein
MRSNRSRWTIESKAESRDAYYNGQQTVIQRTGTKIGKGGGGQGPGRTSMGFHLYTTLICKSALCVADGHRGTHPRAVVDIGLKSPLPECRSMSTQSSRLSHAILLGGSTSTGMTWLIPPHISYTIIIDMFFFFFIFNQERQHIF